MQISLWLLTIGPGLYSCEDTAGFMGVCTSNHAWTHVGLKKIYDRVSLGILWGCTIGT